MQALMDTNILIDYLSGVAAARGDSALYFGVTKPATPRAEIILRTAHPGGLLFWIHFGNRHG